MLARAHMHLCQGPSPASRERLRTRIGYGPPCACIRSAGRVYMCLALQARDQSQRAFARAGTESARAPSRAYAANEISRLPIGRARHLCAPIRDALARACLPVCCAATGRARAGVCAMRPPMRVRAVAHPCASCMRAVVLAPACASPYAIARGCETHPRKGAPNRM